MILMMICFFYGPAIGPICRAFVALATNHTRSLDPRLRGAGESAEVWQGQVQGQGSTVFQGWIGSPHGILQTFQLDPFMIHEHQFSNTPFVASRLHLRSNRGRQTKWPEKCEHDLCHSNGSLLVCAFCPDDPVWCPALKSNIVSVFACCSSRQPAHIFG